MAGFNVAAGMYETTFNSVVAQFYHALYPNFLKDTVQVDEVGISSVVFDIQAPPTVSLAPSQTAKGHIKAAFESIHQNKYSQQLAVAPASNKSTLLEMASSATFTVTASKVALTVNYSSGSNPTKISSASLVAHATVAVGDESNLTFKIVSGTVSVPNNPALTELLNKALIPYLIKYLDENILNPIKIPPLVFKSLKLSTPLPVVQQSYFNVFSSLGSGPHSIPKPMQWPKNGIYVAADIATMEAAAHTYFPIGPKEAFSWKDISGEAGVTANAPTVSNISADGSISAKIELEVSCQLTLHTLLPLPNISFGPKATTGLACEFRPLIEDSEVKVALANIPNISFSFDWGIPSLWKYLLEPLEEGLSATLNAILGDLIGDLLKKLKFSICKIPTIPIDFGDGKKIQISIDQATPKGYQGSLLIVTAQATVTN